MNSYQSHVLVSSPGNPFDRFSKSVILVTAHTRRIAVGIQLNSRLLNTSLATISAHCGYPWKRREQGHVFFGGDERTTRLNIVHSVDWMCDQTIRVTNDIGITSSMNILEALAAGKGPQKYRACLGHWEWEGGELDEQMSSEETDHKWEACPATADIAFSGQGTFQWCYSMRACARHAVDNVFSFS